MYHLISKDGFVINPNQRTVEAITSLLERNGGTCPCGSNKSEDKTCPCSDFREKGVCCCGLYIREEDVQ